MKKTLERSSNTISISTFYEEHSINKYDMNPRYQRKSIWSDEKKSFFVDSILKNLPIPPIFLRQTIDDNTGKTTYEVIDGKQRLTAIIEFIENKITAADEADDPLHDGEISGKLFSEIEGKELGEYKRRFWRYLIPVEYVDTKDDDVIDRIFDRLNRNGEPLTGQELRHSSYYSSHLLNLCYELAKNPFWSDRLNVTDKSRMEDIELLSEFIFVLLESKELKSSDDEIDALYLKYACDDQIHWDQIKEKFILISDYMQELNLDYATHKIQGVSHLYGLWCFSKHCFENGITSHSITIKLNDFYTNLRSRNYSNSNIDSYKKSMSYSTKSQSQRRKRKEALVDYCS